jgi:Zn-finger nucleic acid-binding protein
MAQLREDLPWPSCGQTMAAFNYGGDSGIILDKCSLCAGLWQDGGALEKVQRAVEASDQDLDADVKRFSGSLREVEAREDALEQQDNRATHSPLIATVANRILYID